MIVSFQNKARWTSAQKQASDNIWETKRGRERETKRVKSRLEDLVNWGSHDTLIKLVSSRMATGNIFGTIAIIPGYNSKRYPTGSLVKIEWSFLALVHRRSHCYRKRLRWYNRPWQRAATTSNFMDRSRSPIIMGAWRVSAFKVVGISIHSPLLVLAAWLDHVVDGW